MSEHGNTAESPTDAMSGDGVADPVRTTPDMVRALLMGSAPEAAHLRAEIEQRLKLGAKW